MKNNKIWILLKSFFIFIFITFSLTTNKVLLLGDNDYLNLTLIYLGVCSLIYFMDKKIYVNFKNKSLGKIWWTLVIIAGTVFSFISVLGKQYSYDYNFLINKLVYSDFINLIKILMVFAGGCAFFIEIFKMIMVLPDWCIHIKLNKKIDKLLEFICGKYSCLKQTIIIILCWLPHLIIAYPGRMTRDAWVEYAQYIKEIPYTTQHPIVYTLLMGHFFDFGEKYLGGINKGLYLLVLVQTVAVIFAISFTLYTIRKLKISRYAGVLATVFFSIVPYFAEYATIITQDTLYCAAILILMNELVLYIFCKDRISCDKIKKIVVYVLHSVLTVIAILLSFMRYNGTYVLKILLIAFVIRSVILIVKKKEHVINLIWIVLLIMIPLISGQKLVEHLNEKYESESISSRVMYVVPMQQVARSIAYHSDDITDAEWRSISKVLNTKKSTIAKKYNPLSFDSIKNYFNEEATPDDIKEFLKVWIKIGIRHPGTYINATINQDYYLFSPFAYNYRYYCYTNEYVKSSQFDMTGVIEDKEELFEKQLDLKEYCVNFARLPVLGFLVNEGWYAIVLIGICVAALCRKKGNIILVAIPMLMTFAFAIIGPTNYGHIRYFFPIMYAMPLLISCYFVKGEENE